MAKTNAATRADLQSFMEQGRDSVSGALGPTPKPRADDGDIHDNKTSGAGVFIRKSARSVADRRRSGPRMPT